VYLAGSRGFARVAKFATEYAPGQGGLDAQANFAAPRVQNRDADVVVDQDRFVYFSAQD